MLRTVGVRALRRPSRLSLPTGQSWLATAAPAPSETPAAPRSVDRWEMFEKNLKFTLYSVLQCQKLCETPRYSMHDEDTLNDFIKATITMAAKDLAPINSFLDANEPQFVDGRAIVPTKTRDAVKTVTDSGFLYAVAEQDVGGLQMPYTVGSACMLALNSASVGVSSYFLLTSAAANLLACHGSQAQKDLYIPHMLSGRFTGTMCLSEPGAGSSLADITTSAAPIDPANGVYSITGNKMWISGGDQNFSETIIHLVLARIHGAPKGVKGISLFIVPREHVNADGSVGESNDVTLMGLNHKMGWRGTTNTALAFGENGKCKGYLIGQPNQGLVMMFHMMNEARIGVGATAAALGLTGYLQSLDYAMQRPQGRPVGAKDQNSPQVPIIEHSDVRRMLVAQKAYAEGATALCLYAAYLFDVTQSATDAKEAQRAGILLDLLTPVVKSWPSEWCLEANKWAIQILGGYGYTRDYPLEQVYRDNRLNMIHEGTNGIQALDLLGRKVVQHNGKGMQYLAEEFSHTVQSTPPELREYADALMDAADRVKKTTLTLLGQGMKGKPDVMLANAHEYLNMFGHTVMSWIWLRQANAAHEALKSASDSDRDFFEGKLLACRYFFRHELPKIRAQAKLLQSLDDTTLQLEPRHF